MLRPTHLTEVGDVSVEVFLVFLDDQVTFVFDLFAVAPLDGAISELEQGGMVAIPCLEIDC